MCKYAKYESTIMPSDFKLSLINIFGIALLLSLFYFLFIDFDYHYNSTESKNTPDDIVNSLLESSEIIFNKNEAEMILKEFMNKKVLSIQQLYKYNDDANYERFHKNCDYHFNTLTLIKANDTNLRIGGFTNQSWETMFMIKGAKEMFIFDINKKEKYEFNELNKIIYCTPLNGPCFGLKALFSDICIGKENWYYLHSISETEKHQKSRMVFTLEKMEVYELKFEENDSKK